MERARQIAAIEAGIAPRARQAAREEIAKLLRDRAAAARSYASTGDACYGDPRALVEPFVAELAAELATQLEARSLWCERHDVRGLPCPICKMERDATPACGEQEKLEQGPGPTCTEPKEHKGDHVAVDPATGKEIARW